MLLGDQGPGAKDIPGLDQFLAGVAIPGQLHRALEQAIHALARLTSAKDQLPRLKAVDLALDGQGTHGVEGVQRQGQGRGMSLV